jgi:hypothetical protein
LFAWRPFFSPERPLSMTTANAVAAFGGGLKGHH